MLSQTLRTLEGDGFVDRRVTPAIPPQVSYSLTPVGAELSTRVVGLVDWINGHVLEIVPGSD